MSSSNESKQQAIFCAAVALLAMALGICNTCVGCSSVKNSIKKNSISHERSISATNSQQENIPEYTTKTESLKIVAEQTKESTLWSDTQQTSHSDYTEQTETDIPEETGFNSEMPAAEDSYPEDTRELQYDIEFTDDYDYYEETAEEDYCSDDNRELYLVDLLGLTLSEVDEQLGNDSEDYYSVDGNMSRIYNSWAICVDADDSGSVVQVTCHTEDDIVISKVDEYGYNALMTVSELCSLFGADDLVMYDESTERYYAYFYSSAYQDDNIAYFYLFDNDEPNTQNYYVSASYVY